MKSLLLGLASATSEMVGNPVPQYFRFNQHFDLAIDFPTYPDGH